MISNHKVSIRIISKISISKVMISKVMISNIIISMFIISKRGIRYIDTPNISVRLG